MFFQSIQNNWMPLISDSVNDWGSSWYQNVRKQEDTGLEDYGEETDETEWTWISMFYFIIHLNVFVKSNIDLISYKKHSATKAECEPDISNLGRYVQIANFWLWSRGFGGLLWRPQWVSGQSPGKNLLFGANQAIKLI